MAFSTRLVCPHPTSKLLIIKTTCLKHISIVCCHRCTLIFAFGLCLCIDFTKGPQVTSLLVQSAALIEILVELSSNCTAATGRFFSELTKALLRTVYILIIGIKIIIVLNEY